MFTISAPLLVNEERWKEALQHDGKSSKKMGISADSVLVDASTCKSGNGYGQ
ncbi:hypothetical protein [Marinomonas sp. CT5]|uniref:hypothetical protein n=1 Tax=Marinomonas sp. CT5 TaxID=2066133 RepID=UPI0020166231|nr:hypothetical protein [Marinomonas sp. CT5]